MKWTGPLALNRPIRHARFRDACDGRGSIVELLGWSLRGWEVDEHPTHRILESKPALFVGQACIEPRATISRPDTAPDFDSATSIVWVTSSVVHCSRTSRWACAVAAWAEWNRSKLSPPFTTHAGGRTAAAVRSRFFVPAREHYISSKFEDPQGRDSYVSAP
jgi:hypothetical protein